MKVNKKLANVTKYIIKSVAKHYANTACPVITYQPKMSSEIKSLRKF